MAQEKCLERAAFSQVGVILQLKREMAQSVAKSHLLLSPTVWLSKKIETILLGVSGVFRSGFVFVSKSLDPPEVRASPGLQKNRN